MGEEFNYLVSLLDSGLDLNSDFILEILASQPRARLFELLEARPDLTNFLAKMFSSEEFWQRRLGGPDLLDEIAYYDCQFPLAPAISMPMLGKLMELATLTGGDIFEAACNLTLYEEPEDLEDIAEAVKSLTFRYIKPLTLEPTYGRAILKCLQGNPQLLAQLLRYTIEVSVGDASDQRYAREFKWFVNILASHPEETKLMLRSLLGEKDYRIHYGYVHLIWKCLQYLTDDVYQSLRQIVEQEIVDIYYRLPWKPPREIAMEYQEFGVHCTYVEMSRFETMALGWNFDSYMDQISGEGARTDIQDGDTMTRKWSVTFAVLEMLEHQESWRVSLFSVLDTLYSWDIDLFDESTWPEGLAEARDPHKVQELTLEVLQDHIEGMELSYEFYLRLLMHEEKKWGPNLLQSPVFQVFLGAYEVLEEDTRALVDLLRAK